MANWIQVPGGRVVNADNIQSSEVQNRVLVFHMVDGSNFSVVYDDSGAAYAAQASVQNALLNPTSGSPVIASISPNDVPINDDQTLVVTGTAFKTTALITIGGFATATTFVSATTLQCVWPNSSLPQSTYDVVYTDDSGGTNTLVNGFTVSGPV